jgi:hypothetical protein
VERDAEPVANADQEIDMGEAPEPPRQRAAQLDPAEVDDGAPLADAREVSGVLVAKSGRRGLAVEPRADRFGDIRAFLLGGRRWPCFLRARRPDYRCQ